MYGRLCHRIGWTLRAPGVVLGRNAHSASDRRIAATRYAELVTSGRGIALWDKALRQQIHPGSKGVVECIPEPHSASLQRGRCG